MTTICTIVSWCITPVTSCIVIIKFVLTTVHKNKATNTTFLCSEKSTTAIYAIIVVKIIIIIIIYLPPK